MNHDQLVMNELHSICTTLIVQQKLIEVKEQILTNYSVN